MGKMPRSKYFSNPNIISMLSSKSSQFLVITPEYGLRKYASGVTSLKKSRANSHNKPSLLEYRVYDKERMLQEIDNKLNLKINAVEENKSLKAQFQKIVSTSSKKELKKKESVRKILHLNGTGCQKNSLLKQRLTYPRMEATLMTMNLENEQLQAEVQKRSEEIQKLKICAEYMQFQEVLIECLVYKEEVDRLKSILNERKKRKAEAKKENQRILNEKMTDILNQQKGVDFMTGQSCQMKEYLDLVLESLTKLRNKNSTILQTKIRLCDDIGILLKKTKLEECPNHKHKVSSTEGKSLKQKKNEKTMCPLIIPQVQQEQISIGSESRANTFIQHKQREREHMQKPSGNDDEISQEQVCTGEVVTTTMKDTIDSYCG